MPPQKPAALALPRAALAADPARYRYLAGWLAVGALVLFSVLWGSRSFGIQDNNEGLYAEVAREMVATGDWIVPHLDGSIYLEKPPLMYWLVAGALRMFGSQPWAVRLVPVLAFLGTLTGIAAFARAMGTPRAGRDAIVVMASAAGVVVMSRSLLFDGPLACALIWQMTFFVRWSVGGRRSDLMAFYALLGVGVMTKGLLAIVLGGGSAVIATVLLTRSWRRIAAIFDPAAILLFLVIVAPWHIAAARREPDFIDFYFVNEHFRRFLGTRIPRDFYTGPVYYYLIRLPLYLGVWAGTLPLLFHRSTSPALGAAADQRTGRVVLATWVVLALVFFSLSEGKANYYLLSTMPALALLLALAWPHDGRQSWRVRGAAVMPLLLGAACCVLPHLMATKARWAFARGTEPLLIGTGVALVAAGLIAWQAAARRSNRFAFFSLAAAGLLLWLPAPALLQRADPQLSQQAVAGFLARHADGPVVLYRDYERLSSLTFCLGRTVPIVDSASNELFYAHEHAPSAATFMSDADFRALAARQRVWLVVALDRWNEVAGRYASLHVRVRHRFDHVVVAVVDPAPPRRHERDDT